MNDRGANGIVRNGLTGAGNCRPTCLEVGVRRVHPARV